MVAEADEYYDGDELAPASNKRRLRNSKLFIGFSLITFAFAGFTFAANISLSSGNIEFGQAVYEISACDQYVGVYPYAGQGRDNPYVKGIDITELDVLACLGNTIKIELFSSSDPLTPLNLYAEYDGRDFREYATRIFLRFSSVYSGEEDITTRFNAISVIDMNGVETRMSGTGVTYTPYIDISFNQVDGSYRLEFFYTPLAPVGSVSRITLESSST